MEIDSGSLSEKNLKIEALADRFFYYPYMLYKSGARHPVLSIHVCVFPLPATRYRRTQTLQELPRKRRSRCGYCCH